MEPPANSLVILHTRRRDLLLEMSRQSETGGNLEPLRSGLWENDLAILREEARVKEEIANKMKPSCA
jgi:hypothetical protein